MCNLDYIWKNCYICIEKAIIMCKLSTEQRDKIGNAINYIASSVHDANKTKILKLLYIFEEEMVKKYGIPFLGIPYQVWCHGPVQPDVFVDLSDNLMIFGDYISEHQGVFKPAKQFDDGEFSDAELEIMQSVIERFGKMTAKQLVKYLHREGSLWYKTAKRSGAFEDFERAVSNNTDVELDLSELLDDSRKAHYRECVAIRETANALKVSANV